MSFYRIYRPQIIADIDNVAVREKLIRLLTKEKSDLPHAYLFSGPKGTGKTTVARIIAKIFNCTKSTKSGNPCGSCEQCVSISNGNNLDVIEIDAASNRGIDEIRQLRERIGFSPSKALFTIYIIDEVHMLTNEAFNALLKTLEEPPKHVVFVLATTELHKVPATIVSRCMQVQFVKAGSSELKNALNRIIKKEKISIKDDAVDTIAEYADGSFRDAVKLLEEISFHKKTVNLEDVRQILSLSTPDSIEKIVLSLQNHNLKDSLDHIKEVKNKGTDLKVYIVEILKYLEKILTNITIDSIDISTSWDRSDLINLINLLSKAYSDMKYSPIIELPLEIAIIEFCGQKNISSADLSEKIKSDKTKKEDKPNQIDNAYVDRGMITLDKLKEHWSSVIEELKPLNHSIAGVMRSSRPKDIENGVVIIEAFYKFHQEKLSEMKVKDMISNTIKKLFGESVTIQIVLGKK